jgi:hypothetical protein
VMNQSADQANLLESRDKLKSSSRQRNSFSKSIKSRMSRKQSLPPGSIIDKSQNVYAPRIFSLIGSNDHQELGEYLNDLGPQCNIMEVVESRLYTALAFAAFKNHPECLEQVIKHAERFNLPGNESPNLRKDVLARWVNKETDEAFSCLHFAAYHGNINLIIKLVDEMGANIHQ